MFKNKLEMKKIKKEITQIRSEHCNKGFHKLGMCTWETDKKKITYLKCRFCNYRGRSWWSI